MLKQAVDRYLLGVRSSLKYFFVDFHSLIGIQLSWVVFDSFNRLDGDITHKCFAALSLKWNTQSIGQTTISWKKNSHN